MYHTVVRLFKNIQQLQSSDFKLLNLHISFLEIYNESIKDLLVATQPLRPLDLQEDTTGISVKNLTKTSVNSLD